MVQSASAVALVTTGGTDLASTATAPSSPKSNRTDPATLLLLGQIAVTLERHAYARASFERILELDAQHAAAHMGMGLVLEAEARYAEAGEWLERSLELDPGLAVSWNTLGVVRARGNDLNGAIDAWRRAVEISPRLSSAWLNLGVTLRKTGDTAGAIDAIEHYAQLVQGDARARAMAMLRSLKAARTPRG